MGGMMVQGLLLFVVLLVGAPLWTNGLPADVSVWAEGDVILWLEDEGFDDTVIQNFRDYHIDGERLLVLDVDDLVELKVARVYAKLLVDQRNKFASRCLIDVDGRICVRTQWYWRLISVLLASPVLIIIALVLTLLTPKRIFGTTQSFVVQFAVWAVGMSWIYFNPGQDIAYWLVNLYIVDRHGHLASFATTLARSFIEVGPSSFLPKTLGTLYFLLNLGVWIFIGDPIQDLLMGTTVCSFQPHSD